MPHSTDTKNVKLDKLSTIPSPIRKQGEVLFKTQNIKMINAEAKINLNEIATVNNS